MPSDTVYVTILRNPVSMFESMYSYYNLEEFYKFKFSRFNSSSQISLPDMSKRFANRIGLNQMFFDLGFNLNQKNVGKPKLNYQAYIEYLDSIFDLVMIEEFIDESLILLKNLLCWSIDDVVAFKMNARIKKYKIGQLAIERIKKLNQADLQLYDYFLAKFKQKLTSLRDLDGEVKELRARRKHWFDECVDTKKRQQNLKSMESTPANIIQFTSKKNDLICKLLTSKELELTKLIRDNQLKLYPDSVFTSIF